MTQPGLVAPTRQSGLMRPDSSGTVRARYEYDPHGRRTKLPGGDLEADFGFTGHYYHAQSGLHLALYRAYEAEIGRWLNRDPTRESGGANLYCYASRNPINNVDLFGLADYNCKETQSILDLVKTEGFVEAAFNHRDGGAFDFKVNNWGDTFEIDGKKLRADQFGNHVAGYGGVYAGGEIGYSFVVFFGILFDFGEHYSKGSLRSFDWDADSSADIRAGAERARYERRLRYMREMSPW